MASNSGERFSVEVSSAGNGVSQAGPDLTTANLKAHEATAGLENSKLNLTQDEALRLGRANTMERMARERDRTPLYTSERGAAGVANNDGVDPAKRNGNAAPEIFSEDTVTFGYPRTVGQTKIYWQMVGLSNNTRLRARDYLGLEKTYALSSPPSCGQEIWLLHHVNDSNLVYTGAIARHREGLVSTSKGGAKVVKAMVISQVVTSFESRMRGYATHFLKLLAEELDQRKDEERIAFSVVYSGPNTDFFHRRG